MPPLLETSAAIPFSASHNQQAFKLLELPPELLALLESANPPTLNLQSDTSLHGTGHAVLSTPDQSLAYHVRQKNTSNMIHLLVPRLASTVVVSAGGGDGGGGGEVLSDGDDGGEGKGGGVVEEARGGMGVCSIAIIEDTLELYPVEKGHGKESGGQGGGKVNKWHEKFAKGRVK